MSEVKLNSMVNKARVDAVDLYARLLQWKEYSTEANGKKVSWNDLLRDLLDDVEGFQVKWNSKLHLMRRLQEVEIEEYEKYNKKS